MASMSISSSGSRAGLNIGWSLGVRCPFNCSFCYTAETRNTAEDLTAQDVDGVIDRLEQLGVAHVTLGGNEPWYSGTPNGTTLVRITRGLADRGIRTSLVTSGPSANRLRSFDPDALRMMVNVAVSIDDPETLAHNKSRGAKLWDVAMTALKNAHESEITPTILFVLKADFDPADIKRLAELCRDYRAYLRVNVLKPTVARTLSLEPSVQILQRCAESLELDFVTLLNTEPGWYADPIRCPCYVDTFRVGFKRKDGEIPALGCQYVPDSEFGVRLLADVNEPNGNMREALRSRLPTEQFGCAARRILAGRDTDPLLASCELQEQTAEMCVGLPDYAKPLLQTNVWRGYLATWMGWPK